MVPIPILPVPVTGSSVNLLFVSIAFRVFLQHVSSIALELLLVSDRYITYPVSCQDSVKIPGVLHNISKYALRVLGLRKKNNQSFNPICLLTQKSPYSDAPKFILCDLPGGLTNVWSVGGCMPDRGLPCQPHKLLSCA